MTSRSANNWKLVDPGERIGNEDARSGEHASLANMLMTPTEVGAFLRVHRKTVDRYLKSDPGFPKPIHIGPASPRYVRREIIEWIDRRAKAR